jgi:hypothetical protein
VNTGLQHRRAVMARMLHEKIANMMLTFGTEPDFSSLAREAKGYGKQLGRGAKKRMAGDQFFKGLQQTVGPRTGDYGIGSAMADAFGGISSNLSSLAAIKPWRQAAKSVAKDFRAQAGEQGIGGKAVGAMKGLWGKVRSGLVGDPAGDAAAMRPVSDVPRPKLQPAGPKEQKLEASQPAAPVISIPAPAGFAPAVTNRSITIA